ncbi:MAG: hypothetical protein RL722_1971 [Pseudomonadota bacterium]|jgi:hemerythrin-like domain-containing protein
MPADASPRDDALAQPLESFSQCHSGIVGRLERLEGLVELLDPAARARQIAADALAFFRQAVFEHHADEERELFPAVQAAAEAGAEAAQVRDVVNQLVHEHREIEALWARLEPALEALAQGRPARAPEHEIAASIAVLVRDYRGHAHFEEVYFLPLAKSILGRQSGDLAALGLALHTRHTLDALITQVGFHV